MQTRAQTYASRPATLFLTVGSTLFPSLTTIALSPAFLDVLFASGVQRLLVQYGRAELPLPDGVMITKRSDKADGHINFEWPGRGAQYKAYQDAKGTKGAYGYGEGPKMEVELIMFTERFGGEVKDAKWVISHAGSGSILTVLHTPRPLLVVPNTDLMDNHQAQLAEALGGGVDGEGEGYLLVSTLEDLLDKLPKLLDEDYTPKPFPKVETDRFKKILDETAGFGS
ncbi:uncharacterized protein MKK02DRAFT_42201 [Dioszegia hungarica]|uniref:UDP-N-acetylglucosamine transferase subunit ALG13 n=1 Tax=Dioszegia hungarica TaxID=4972 RepID=A0AA38LWH5_9TREE|nr:uncharacterized protein MKK02DRAFT_42201 [Dioszegia hungarica]KAI9637828.1 hypothetical protein MKK02DRAFT_42201 [Dioszegia hungarica]